jgi:hypothetical protein
MIAIFCNEKENLFFCVVFKMNEIHFHLNKMFLMKPYDVLRVMSIYVMFSF